MSSLFEVPEALALAISLAVAPLPATDADMAVQVSGSLPDAVVAKFARRFEPVPAQLQYNALSWLHAVRDARHLPAYGKISSRIFETSSGLLYVPVKGERDAIDALRWDFSAAFTLAGVQAQRHRRQLALELTRSPKAVDLYIAHRLGPAKAASLIRLAIEHPRANIAAKFPRLAFKHLDLFFGKRGARRSRDVYRLIERSFGRALRRAVKIAGLKVAAPEPVLASLRSSRLRGDERLRRSIRSSPARPREDRLRQDRVGALARLTVAPRMQTAQ